MKERKTLRIKAVHIDSKSKRRQNGKKKFKCPLKIQQSRKKKKREGGDQKNDTKTNPMLCLKIKKEQHCFSPNSR